MSTWPFLTTEQDDRPAILRLLERQESAIRETELRADLTEDQRAAVLQLQRSNRESIYQALAALQGAADE